MSTNAKKITVQGTAGTRHAEYNPISDSYLRANPNAVLTALIHGINAHCADMLITMLDIMADKYGHSTNDLIDTVKGDERWKAVSEHPVLNSLGYFDHEDANRVVGKKSAASMTAEELHDSEKSAKIAKPAAVEEAAHVEEKPKAKKAPTKKAAAVIEVKETITHAEAYGYGDADITPGHDAVVEEAAPAKAKKSTKKAVASEEAPAPVEAAPEPAPAPAKVKKSTKKAAETPVEEAAEVKPKKTTKKAAAVDDANVEALTESVSKLSTEEAAPAKKKVVSKKPVAAKPA
jgi:hypothetical protein